MLKTEERIRAIELAKKDGLTPEQMSVAQWRMYAIRVRAPKELVKDTFSAVAAFADTEIFGRNIVSDAQIEKVKNICLTQCPAKPSALHSLRGGQYLCDKCDCSGKMLNVKWKHAKSKCPLGAWDNAEAISATDVVDGERTAPTGNVLEDHPEGRSDLPVHEQQQPDHS